MCLGQGLCEKELTKVFTGKVKADFHSMQNVARGDFLRSLAFFWNTNSQAEQISLAVVQLLHTFPKRKRSQKSIVRHFALNENPPYWLTFTLRSISYPEYARSQVRRWACPLANLRTGILWVTRLPGCSIYCSRTFGTLFWNDMKWSAHGVLEQCWVYYICVQSCITILISYSHNKAYNDSLLFLYLSMLLQRFYSLIYIISICRYIAVNPSK
jgi:hypothetical protein